MKIKKDDNVIVISGKDRGKTGKVSQAFPRLDRVTIVGVNIRKVHKKARKSGQKAQMIEQSFPIHVSNVMVVDPKTGKRTRTGKKMVDGKLARVTKKSGTVI